MNVLAEPRRERAAILFADVHGYSRLMSRDELGTYERVIRSIALIKSLITDYGGRVVQTMGDGVLALFEDAGRAVSFAVEMQRAFRKDVVWNGDGTAIAFRIGINQGEVLIGETGVQGHDVNIAARIQSLAAPGGICVSSKTYKAVLGSTKIAMRPLGLKRLKNIADPVEVFDVKIDGYDKGQAAETAVERRPNSRRSEQVRVAVLPLDSLSVDPRDRRLCEGLTGDIITSLSRFDDLGIIAHHLTKIIKQQRMPSTEAMKRLGIRYFLTGALQRQGATFRLRVELVDARSNNILWSDRFRGDLIDVFEFQDEVTNLVASRLAIQIADAERRRLSEIVSPDIRAYGLVLRGQGLDIQFRKDSNRPARRAAAQAAKVDPCIGGGYAAMSRTFNLDWRYAWPSDPFGSLGDKALDLVDTAIDDDPLDARGGGTLGRAKPCKK